MNKYSRVISGLYVISSVSSGRIIYGLQFLFSDSEEIKVKCYIESINPEALGQKRHSFYVFVNWTSLLATTPLFKNAKPVRTAAVFSSPGQPGGSKSAKPIIEEDSRLFTGNQRSRSSKKTPVCSQAISEADHRRRLPPVHRQSAKPIIEEDSRLFIGNQRSRSSKKIPACSQATVLVY